MTTSLAPQVVTANAQYHPALPPPQSAMKQQIPHADGNAFVHRIVDSSVLMAIDQNWRRDPSDRAALTQLQANEIVARYMVAVLDRLQDIAAVHAEHQRDVIDLVGKGPYARRGHSLVMSARFSTCDEDCRAGISSSIGPWTMSVSGWASSISTQRSMASGGRTSSAAVQVKYLPEHRSRALRKFGIAPIFDSFRT